jgi:RHS repeat-associated protein
LTDKRTGSSNWQYDAANQLLQRGSVTYTYDDAGNLVKKVDASLAEPARTTEFEYDAGRRLRRVKDGAGATVASYAYDPFDRRLSKQLSDGTTTYYLYSEVGLAAEVDASGKVLVSYGWHPEHEDSTYPLFARMPDPANGATAYRYVYYHNDQLGTPQRITDKAGTLLWKAEYDSFGKATVTATATHPITNNLRFPGQYFDAETGLHYNNRRFYEPESGRYVTRDPIGFEGGLNLYAYARHNPVVYTDPSGEIIPCLAINYLRCMAACMLISTASDAVLNCGNVNWGDNAKDCAIECLWDMLPIPNPCGKFGKWAAAAMGAAAGLNSFAPDTLVHVKPKDASDADAQLGKSELKPIGELKVGDQVLAWAEWKAAGAKAQSDARLGYERVTEVFTSKRQQTLVHLTLESGQTITATDGHPFKTTDGWRDAVLLKRGGKLLLKGQAEEGFERELVITDVRIEKRTLQVFNLEVANAHTFLVGTDGVVVHNGHGHHAWPKYLGGPKKQDLVDLDPQLHYDYHSGLDKILPRCKGKKHYDKKRGKNRRQMNEDFRDYTEGFDAANGTDLMGAARGNGFPL